jgi:hypothetical protein
MLAFRFDRDRIASEGVQPTFSVGLLKELAPFGGRRDGIEHARIGDTRFGVIRDELIAVGGDANAGYRGARSSIASRDHS